MAVETLVRFPDVMKRVGLGRSRLYAMIAAGEFPAPVRLGVRSVAWRESDLVSWIASRPSARPSISATPEAKS